MNRLAKMKFSTSKKRHQIFWIIHAKKPQAIIKSRLSVPIKKAIKWNIFYPSPVKRTGFITHFIMFNYCTSFSIKVDIPSLKIGFTPIPPIWICKFRTSFSFEEGLWWKYFVWAVLVRPVLLWNKIHIFFFDHSRQKGSWIILVFKSRLISNFTF